MKLHKLDNAESSLWIGCPLCKKPIDVIEVKTSKGLRWCVKCKDKKCIMRDTKPVESLDTLFSIWNSEHRMIEVDTFIADAINKNLQTEKEIPDLTAYEKKFFRSAGKKLVKH